MSSPRSNAAPLAIAMMIAANPVVAQTTDNNSAYSATGQPSTYDLTGAPAVINGYLSSRWGMDEAAVRDAASRDFGAPPGRASAAIDPATGAQVLTLAVNALAPGPGTATVSYVLASGRLTAVNIAWRGDQAALAAAAAELVRPLRGQTWRVFSTAVGVPIGPRTLIVFAGSDEQARGVEVRLDNIDYLVTHGDPRDASPQSSAPASGKSAVLRLVFAEKIPQFVPRSIAPAAPSSPPASPSRPRN